MTSPVTRIRVDLAALKKAEEKVKLGIKTTPKYKILHLRTPKPAPLLIWLSLLRQAEAAVAAKNTAKTRTRTFYSAFRIPNSALKKGVDKEAEVW